MPAPRRLIAATDFSEAAGHAVDRAYELASTHHSELMLAHGLGLDGLTLLQGLLGPRLPEVAESLHGAAMSRLEQLAAEPGRPAGVSAEFAVDVGSASRFVDRLVRAQHADLLLVGARNGDLLHRVLMGSTASRLHRTSPCPVLSVKQPVTGPYRRVLIGVGEGADAERHVRIARAMVPNAELILLHALTAPQDNTLREAGVTDDMLGAFRDSQIREAEQRLHDFTRRLGLPETGTRRVVVIGDAARALLDYETAGECDLLVVGRIDRNTEESLPVGSATRQVLAGSTADVLVIADAATES